MPFDWAERAPCTQAVLSECLWTGRGAELCPRGVKAEPAARPSKTPCPVEVTTEQQERSPAGSSWQQGGAGPGSGVTEVAFVEATDALHPAPCRRPSGVAFPSPSVLLLRAFARGAPRRPRGDSKSSLPAGLTVSSPRLHPACLPAPGPLRVRWLKVNSGSPTPSLLLLHLVPPSTTLLRPQPGIPRSCRLPVARCSAGTGKPRKLSAPQHFHSASLCPSARSGRGPLTAAPPRPHGVACVMEQLESPLLF